jgi:hypothetical protein
MESTIVPRGSNMKRISFMMITFGIAAILLIPFSTMGYSYYIAPGDNDSQTIFGSAGDDISIDLVSTDQPIDLLIMTFSDYLGYNSPADDTTTYTVDAGDDDFELVMGNSGDVFEIELISSTQPVDLMMADDFMFMETADIDWSQTGVTSGEWTWTKPDDEGWYLIINNTNAEDVVCEIRMSNTDAYDVVWSKTGVTEGAWAWRMPSDDMWELIILNPNDEPASVEVVIGGGNFLNEGSDAGCGEVMAAAIFVPLVAILMLALYVKKR